MQENLIFDSSSKNKPIIVELVENIQYGVRVIDSDKKVIYLNKAMKRIFDDKVGNKCSRLFDHADIDEGCLADLSMKEKKEVSKDATINDRCYKITASSISMEQGKRFSIEVFQDITEMKKLEYELLTKYNQLKKETEIARNIQHSILPEDGIYWDALRLNSIYLPTDDLGGDLYDILHVDERKVLLYIADVSGHGVQASLLTIFLRQLIRTYAEMTKKKLGSLIDILHREFKDLDISGEMYFSVLLCVYDRSDNTVTIANAGHNCYPIIIRNNGRVEEIQVKGLPISKLSSDFIYPEERIGIYENERIVLYTDGIIEEYSEIKKKPFGSEGIRKIVEDNYKMDGKELIRLIIDEAIGDADKKTKDDRAMLIADIL